MKFVLLAHRYLPRFLGGVEVYTHRLAQALKQLGHDITIIALDPTNDTSSETITVYLDEYDHTVVWRLRLSPARRPWQTYVHAYDPEVGQIVKRILQDENPDILIIMNFYLVTLAPVEAASDLGIPVMHVATDFTPVCRLYTFIRGDGSPCQAGESIKSCAACYLSGHILGRLATSVLDRLPEETIVRWAHRRRRGIFLLWKLLQPYWDQVIVTEQRLKTIRPLREKIDLVLAPTKYTLKVFLANGFRPAQLFLLPFGVTSDSPLASVKHVPAAHARFLFIGRFQPYKGAHLLIEAFNHLPSPQGATVTFYGKADGHDAYFSQLKAMAAANERIHFGGRIAPTALADAFAKADFFVLPVTWHENSPLILLDAVESKTPVIASDVGGVTDIIKHEVNGLLFPMGDKRALQQLMQRVIDQPGLADQLRPSITLPRIDDCAKTIVKLCRDRLLVSETRRATHSL